VSTDGTVRGVCYHVSERELIGEKKIAKVTLVIETLDKYPQRIAVECWGTLADTAADVANGDKVEADYYLRGREWNTRFFTSLRGADIRVIDAAPTRQSAPQPAESKPAATDGAGTGTDENLPF
jgi:hypothetical protein